MQAHSDTTEERDQRRHDEKFIRLAHKPTYRWAETTLALRLMAGGVFLWEGILKFVYANQGIGPFTKLVCHCRTSPLTSWRALKLSLDC